MTDSKNKWDFDSFLVLFSSLIALLLLLSFPSEVSRGVRDGLALCYRAIIPAVFPFAILAEMIVTADLTPLDKTLGRAVGAPLGVSPIGGRTVLLGFLFGFPLGAKMVAELYKQHRLEEEEAERLLFASALPSPAFLISGVGVSMLGDVRCGLVLMLISALSAFAVSMLLPRKRGKAPRTIQEVSLPSISGRSLNLAIAGAARSTLTVTATVTCFSILSALTARLIRDPVISKTISAILELGSGTAGASALILSGVGLGRLLLGFAVSFSGLSVYLQIRAVIADSGLRARWYLPAKLVSGAISAALCFFVFG